MSVRLPAAQRREQLLDVAMTTFSEQGYHGASMNDVAAAAGVTKPVLYQHFPSKRELYLELLDTVGSRLGEVITESAVGDTPRDRARGALVAYFEYVADNKRAFHLLFGRGAPREDEFATGVRTVQKRMAGTIEQLLDPALGDERRTLIARSLIGLSEAACNHWLETGGTLSAEDLATEIADLIVFGLSGTRAPTP